MFFGYFRKHRKEMMNKSNTTYVWGSSNSNNCTMKNAKIICTLVEKADKISFRALKMVSLLSHRNLIDFKGMSACLVLFRAKRLRNCFHYIHSYLHFLCICLRVLFLICTWSYEIQMIFNQIYLTHRRPPNKYNHSSSEWTWN